jgi:diguanylate cyclase (GGDEF)-like protein
LNSGLTPEGEEIRPAALRELDVRRQAAHRLAGRRPADLAARFGGEELAIILPGTPLEGAVEVAKSVARLIAQLAIPHSQSGIGPSVTLGQGIVSLNPDHETLPEQLIERADHALYQAKQQSRSRYVVFGPDSVN